MRTYGKSVLCRRNITDEQQCMLFNQKAAEMNVYADEMTWGSDAAEGEEAEVQTEEGAVTAAFRRAFRAVDEEVTGSVTLYSSHDVLAALHQVLCDNRQGRASSFYKALAGLRK